MSDIIEVEHFSKRYGDFIAVDDISFTVEEGSIFAFLGPNGAGKSTTINTLCTILDKSEGNIYVAGHDVSKEKSLVRRDIGIVFQEPTLDEKMTVEENLKYHCAFYQVPKNEVQERIDFALGLVELLDWRKSPIAALSGGMKRRAEIARGLVHYPKILFLDEPTTGLLVVLFVLYGAIACFSSSFLVEPVFARERASKMDSLILSSRNGRRKDVTAKILAVLVTSTALGRALASS